MRYFYKLRLNTIMFFEWLHHQNSFWQSPNFLIWMIWCPLSQIWEIIFSCVLFRDKNNEILTFFLIRVKAKSLIMESLLHRNLSKHNKINPWRQSPGSCTKSRAFNSPGNPSCVLYQPCITYCSRRLLVLQKGSVPDESFLSFKQINEM